MSKWRDTYKVNPSSDCFPIMSEDELDALAAEDPADPRGACEDDGVKIIRHRAWDYMSDEALRMAEAFLAEHGHRAIAQADASEIDDEIVRAVFRAAMAWAKVHAELERKRAHT
jgi:hypothetical protein